jgi:hypothetical protein
MAGRVSLMPTRKQRGHDTERYVADWLGTHGWPWAEPVGAGRSGSDVTGIPGLVIEVKARRSLDLTGWLRQHAGHNGLLPCVIVRPDGYGPERIADWPVITRLDDFTRLLHEAGYGSKGYGDQEDS